MSALDDLLKDVTAGDPITGIKWTRKTLRKITRELRRQGYEVQRETVHRLLLESGYRLRVNRKRLTKKRNPDRDRQMRYMSRERAHYVKQKKPVISVDGKKRELVGNFKNAGRTWRKSPADVFEKDFPTDAKGIALPYGIYDVVRNYGFIVVGTSHQTAAFAVNSIRKWWVKIGRVLFPTQHELLIEADSGGANASNSWLWKWELQKMANDFGLTITVAHLPTGASKWNSIEHRLFSEISRNWAGEPLVSYEAVLKYIRTTKTEKGLKCQAVLDTAIYKTKLKVTAEQKMLINLKPHRVLPTWNYTIKPVTPLVVN